MKIAITGASGQLGKEISKELGFKVESLVCVTRKLPPKFDGNWIEYESIPEKLKNFDAIIHLAAKNNNEDGSQEEFQAANVDFLLSTIARAKKAKIKTFINVSSSHALPYSERTDFYSLSKKEGIERANEETGIAIHNLFLPAVYTSDTKGKLRHLEKTPSWLRGKLIKVLNALHPLTTLDHVSSKLKEIIYDPNMEHRNHFVRKAQSNKLLLFFKRGLDILFSLSILILLWWLLILVWVIIKLESPGPSLFKQKRIGKNGTQFVCYKFRTMFIETPQLGTHEVSKSNVTKVGKFLRKTKIDELPQIFNLLKNEMSLCGPRPNLPNQIELIEFRKKHMVYDVLPGITGLAQVNRIDMSEPEKLAKCDAIYIAQMSILNDIKIVLKTFLGKGSGDPNEKSITDG